MRQVKFQEVGMENYGPYLDPMLLEFNEDRLVLITGKNGIGKTMALDAIPFTLYGSTSKGMKGDDVVNNTAGKDCKTWVKFTVDGEQYQVTRYQKYSKIGNSVILSKGGVDMKKGQREVLPEVEKLICSERSFMNTLMFGQKVKDFFTDLVDSDKKKIFRELLALEKYQDYYDESGNRLKNIETLLTKLQMDRGIKEGLLEDIHQQIEILKAAEVKFEVEKKESIDELKKGIDTDNRLLKEWQSTLETLKEPDHDVAATTSEIVKVESELSTLKSSIDSSIESIKSSSQNKLHEVKSKASISEKEIEKETKERLSYLNSKMNELKEKQSVFESDIQQKRHSIELEISKIDNAIASIEKRSDEINVSIQQTANVAECPLCQQEISKETINLLESTVEENGKEIEAYNKEARKLLDKIKELNAESDSVIKKVNGYKAEVNAAIKEAEEKEEKEIREIQNRLIEVISQIEAYTEDEVSKKYLEISKKKVELESTIEILKEKKRQQERVVDEINTITKTITDLENTINTKTNNIAAYEKSEYDKTQLNAYLKKLRDTEIELNLIQEEGQKTARKKSILEFWKTAFSSSGIPSMLIDEAIPFMNERVTHYLEKFTNGRYIVSFDTMATTKKGEFRDKISVNVIDTYTRANARVQLSGGQTRIVDIATILTLADLQESIQNVSINILLFDEIFDALDEENIGYVAKFLTKLKIGKSIYLISHRHEDQLETDEVLAFR